MQNEIMSEIVFSSRYSKETKEGRETWENAVDRVINMHKAKFKFNPEILKYINKSFDLVKKKRVYASQRSMQFGGISILKNNMRIYNCTYSHCNRLRFFAENFFLLLSGCGTGFSLRKHHINKLSPIISPKNWKNRYSQTFMISDNIEGWSDSIWFLLLSYQDQKSSFHNKELVFDYSNLRPKGSKIRSGGVSPGYEALQTAIEKIRSKLREVSYKENRKLSSVDCFDIIMYLSEVVATGGVRRSASIALFDEDDEEMIVSKHSPNIEENRQRHRANISVAYNLNDKDNSADIYKNMRLAFKNGGEPGVTFFNSKEFGTNPCAEIGLSPNLIRDTKNKIIKEVSLDMLDNPENYLEYNYTTGWSACNLTEIDMNQNRTIEEFYEACEAASIIGTIQAAYTDAGYLLKTTQDILENEALLGVSLTGMSGNPISFNPEVLEAGVQIVIDTNKKIASLLGINEASRFTCIKPSGTTSTLAVTSAGIHPYHSKKYIRRVELSKENVIWKELLNKVPEACIDKDKSSGIVSFACIAPENSITRDQDTSLEFLKRVKLVYDHWIYPGSKNSRVEGLSHSVSNTCSIKEEDFEEIAEYICNNKESLRGVSFFPHSDQVYKNQPFEAVYPNSKAEVLFNKLSKLDYSKVKLNLKGKTEDPNLDSACTGGACEF